MFVDGLDDYGDHHDLITTIHKIAQLHNVKTCVASRPGNCFEDAFGQEANRKLCLQDLTKEDIGNFARDMLMKVHSSNLASSEINGLEGLIAEIIQRSQGVFLWVFLVVHSLREGLINAGPLSLPHERLLEMPSDLAEFFKKLIMSVNTMYRRRMAYTFSIVLTAPKPLRLLFYSCIDEKPPSTTLKSLPSSSLSKREWRNVFLAEQLMDRQLNGRFKARASHATSKRYAQTCTLSGSISAQ